MQTTKKKYTQNDLRRLMTEHKAKVAPKIVQHKIDSPLAKYPLQYYSTQFNHWPFSLIIFSNFLNQT